MFSSEKLLLRDKNKNKIVIKKMKESLLEIAF